MPRNRASYIPKVRVKQPEKPPRNPKNSKDVMKGVVAVPTPAKPPRKLFQGFHDLKALGRRGKK